MGRVLDGALAFIDTAFSGIGSLMWTMMFGTSFIMDPSAGFGGAFSSRRGIRFVDAPKEGPVFLRREIKNKEAVRVFERDLALLTSQEWMDVANGIRAADLAAANRVLERVNLVLKKHEPGGLVLARKEDHVIKFITPWLEPGHQRDLTELITAQFARSAEQINGEDEAGEPRVGYVVTLWKSLVGDLMNDGNPHVRETAARKLEKLITIISSQVEGELTPWSVYLRLGKAHQNIFRPVIEKVDELRGGQLSALPVFSKEAIDNYFLFGTDVASKLEIERLFMDFVGMLMSFVDSPFGEGRYSELLRDVTLDITRDRRVRNLNLRSVLELCAGKKAFGSYEGLSMEIAEWIFIGFQGNFFDLLGSLKDMGGKGEVTRERLAELKRHADWAHQQVLNLSDFIHKVEALIDVLKKKTGFFERTDYIEYYEKWRKLIKSDRAKLHDIVNIMSPIIGFLGIALASREKAEKSVATILKVVDNYRSRTLKGIIASAASITANSEVQVEALRHHVTVEIGPVVDMEVAEADAFELFRCITELTKNAIKNRDKTRTDSRVVILTHKDEHYGYVFVADNGIGIKDPEKVLEFGYQETVGNGHGNGISNSGIGLYGISEIAGEKGLIFGINPDLGGMGLPKELLAGLKSMKTVMMLGVPMRAEKEVERKKQ